MNFLVRFSTAYHDEASLGDIFDAGLVTETQVRDLEQGVISESDLYDQLKTYLFGGEEPVSGVILQDTGKRSNSKLCNASNDFVGSTVIKVSFVVYVSKFKVLSLLSFYLSSKYIWLKPSRTVVSG